MEFLNNLWNNAKLGYFKVRNFIVRTIAKTGVLQYAESLIETVKIKQILGHEVTFKDQIKRAAGYVLFFGTAFVIGAVIGLVSVVPIIALSYLVGGFLATLIVAIARTLFIFDLMEHLYYAVQREKSVSIIEQFRKSALQEHGLNFAAA